MSREAFEKWYQDKFKRAAIESGYETYLTWQAWQAAQAQASKPIAVVHGWFHGECVIRPLDPEAVLPAGMALYSQPQAHAGEGEAYGWVSEHTNGITYFDKAYNEIYRDTALSITPVYTAPPAKVNQQLLEALRVFVECWNDDSGTSNPYPEDVIKARAAIAAAQEQPQDGAKQKYTELLYAVSTKHPGETRHETALRYIRQAENSDCQAAAQEQSK